MQEKRDQQLSLRDSVREALHGLNMWCALDKPPKLRSISKAVGRLSGFLQERFKLPKDHLVVGSWPLAKCFVGEHLLTGLIGAPGAKPPTDPSQLRWLIHDEPNHVRVWVDLTSLAPALSLSFEQTVQAWDAHFGPLAAGDGRLP